MAKHKTDEVALAAGARLVSAGDPVVSLFVLRDGILLARHDRTGEQPRISGLFWPGELVLADPAARGWAADLYASTDVRVDVYDLGGLRSVMRADPDLALLLFDAACRDLSRRLGFEHRLRILAVEGRFAALIAQFARCLGEPHEEGRVFSLPLLRAELASYLGLRTETVCRVLARWQKRGLITLEGRRVFILHNLAEIEALASDAGQ